MALPPHFGRRFALGIGAVAVGVGAVVAAALAAVTADAIAIALGVAVGLSMITAGIWFIPRRQVTYWRRAGITSEEKLAELVLQARTNLTQAIGGLALVATLLITAYQVNETRRSSNKTLRLTEQGQLAERFARAIEELDATNSDRTAAVDTRIGGLFSLLGVGRDSARDLRSAYLVAAAYVRNNVQPGGDGGGWRDPRDACAPHRRRSKPRADVHAALTVVLTSLSQLLAERPGDEGGVADLSDTDFTGLVLTRIDLSGLILDRASLRDADLQSASLGHATLQFSDLRGACLASADLEAADVTNADARGADLSNARLVGATLKLVDLSSARLVGADLESANLEEAALRRATLSGANLRGARLDLADLRANLSGSDLSHTSLRDAVFARANLSGADLREAELAGADLRGADLRGADLRGARLSPGALKVAIVDATTKR